MRIVNPTSTRIPSRTANSIQVMKMCQAFAKNGHEVILLALTNRDTETDVNSLFQFYGVDACFRFKRFPPRRPKLKGLIKNHLVVALKVWLCRPDLVFTRSLDLGFSVSMIGLPVILEAHNIINPNEHRKKTQLSELIRSKHFKRLVVTSDAIRKAYQQDYNIPPSLIKVAHNGADEPAQFETLPLGPPTRLQVGYVGNLYPGKGMEIISELAKSCPWGDFHIVGGTESDLTYWRTKLEEVDNVFFQGFLPFPKAGQFRQSVDVLIAPYQHQVSVAGGKEIDARFMSPLKIFEYMAAGKALLASDLPALREVLTHGDSAWLCAPEDLKCWIAGLTHLRDNPELRNCLGLRAREKFRAQHTWQTRAASILEGLT